MDPDQLERLVEAGADSYNRRDAEAAVAMWEPDCEWNPFIAAEVENAEPYRGHEGLRQWFRDTDEMFSEVLWQPQEAHDLDGDRVLVLGRLIARGKLSGAEIDSPIGQLFELRGGKIARGWAYLSHEEARRAAGLPAQDAP